MALLSLLALMTQVDLRNSTSPNPCVISPPATALLCSLDQC